MKINKGKKKLKYHYIFKLNVLLIILILMKFDLYFNIKKKSNLIKVCLCSVGKLENKYIREFVEHYKKYKIDKIFIYDNNEIDGERFDYILKDYINNKFVEIINFRGKIGKQLIMFEDCYKKNAMKYDWLIFYDIDEFINLKTIINIKDFLNQKKFSRCQSIYLNWVIHTDNNLIYYIINHQHKDSQKFIKTKIIVMVKL